VSAAHVEVFCEEPSHEGRQWLVFRFEYRQLYDGSIRWMPGSSSLMTRDTYSPGSPRVRAMDSAAASLVGDRYVSEADIDADPMLLHDETFRTRYRFRCDICGLNAVLRSEKVYALLDQLAAASISQISLRGLLDVAGRLSS
jgi:hypothetical protein